MNSKHKTTPESVVSFFKQQQVETDIIPVGDGVLLGVKQVFKPDVGIGGIYGAWGESYDNKALPRFIERYYGRPLYDDEQMNLSPLGFVHRHHISELSEEENLKLEVEVGARFLRGAADANGWDPSEVDGVFIGMTVPIADNYVERIAKEAGIPDNALKVSIHKACDGSMGALHMILNPELSVHQQLNRNVARELYGKKVLVGGIEGLSRMVRVSRDKSAMQLFGNGAGIIGVIPGQTMKFIVGKSHEVYDEKGVLAVAMYYPHSGQRKSGHSMVEVSQAGNNHFRIAGLMHEPDDDSPIVMAGPMGMVKLFVRTGVQVVRDVYNKYQAKMEELGSTKEIKVAIAHHANLKINQLKAKHLKKIGINIPTPWMLSEFGNISAASNMIAFLRQLSNIRPGDHILFDGFGAGTYYDTFAVALGEPA